MRCPHPSLVLRNILLAVLCLSATAGCFNYDEEIWIYESGAGTIEGRVRIPGDIWRTAVEGADTPWSDPRAELTRLAGRIDGVELREFDETVTSASYRAKWAFSFDTTEALQDLLREGTGLLTTLPEGGPFLRPPADSVEQLGRLGQLQRTAAPAPAVLEGELPLHVFRDATISVTIHTAVPIIHAEPGRISSEGNTVTWNTSLEDVLHNGATLNVSYRKPFPLLPTVGGVGGLLAALAGIWGFAWLHMSSTTTGGENDGETGSGSKKSSDEDSSSGEFGSDWGEM